MRKHVARASFAAFVLALAGLLIAAPGQAQDQDSSARSQAQAEQIPQEELDRYATAYLQIAQVRQQMQQDMQNASSQEERQSVRESANQEMSSILEEHGISVQRYREITNILNSDQQQRQEFTSLVQQKRQQSGGDTSGNNR